MTCNYNCSQGRTCDCRMETRQFDEREDSPPMSRLDALCVAGAIVLSIAAAVILVTVPH